MAESDANGHYPRLTLQRDLDAIVAAGAVGVVAEVDTGQSRMVVRGGVADTATAERVPFGAHFRIGSNTKTFVAVVALRLVAEGRLSLDDSVRRWLPDLLTGSDYDADAIRVHDLLQHTSGLFDYTNDERFGAIMNEDGGLLSRFAPSDLVKFTIDHPPLFWPGSKWGYSNTNYVIVGMIIEQVTGRSWGDEVTERIIRPLRLRETVVPQGPQLPEPHAVGYYWDGETGQFLDVTMMDPSWAAASGSMISTVHDLGVFWRAVGRGRLLPPEQVKQMRTTVPMNDPERPTAAYGLGIGSVELSCGGLYWSHHGGLPGYSTRNAVSDDGRASVVISVTGHEKSDQIRVLADQIIDRALCSAR
ncbi:MAG TPA: serine hydrolase domain-containing protein [Candidatus Limnocylindrales bacterium]|nr:serine hydrolase domain-containing protein [Candidatus Limnocylindrales bacterium]